MLYDDFIHMSRYARHIDGRRETWEETVDRYIDFWGDKLPSATQKKVRKAILNREVMPSMRALMTAGEALTRDNVAGYNCAYIAMDKTFKFSEVMYVLMCGTGVGFSVERDYINKLPEIAEDFYDTDTTLVVADSKIGWAKAFKELIAMLYSGQIPKWDVSKIRPAGEPLKVFGGRASGPAPLEDLFRFSVETFTKAKGRKLTPLEVHDVVCKIADIVVVGGVRRSALISLSNVNDTGMATAKSGAWFYAAPHRSLANNSGVFNSSHTFPEFLREWHNLYESRSGERGIFNREAAREAAGRSGRRDVEKDFGTNPCSEIILRDREFCNLTEVIVRAEDTRASLREKVEIATILGTLQSTLTDFRFLSADWKKNCEEERLLGVSLTGICDNKMMVTNNEKLKKFLEELKVHSVSVNKRWAKKFGINPSAAITCVKPSGTVSQLCNTSSGIHPRYSRFYIRNVRLDKKDPLGKFLIGAGVPCIDAPEKPDDMWVFSFPVESPKDCMVAGEFSSLDQLELWKTYAQHWCEHKPSMTVYYDDDSFLAVGDWVWENFGILSGVSFLPHSDHTYAAAPYEPITEKEFKKLTKKMPEIDFSEYRETLDYTTSSQEFACTGDKCEI
jgi:ribonucleoside-diphosphate reductase alpha chain